MNINEKVKTISNWLKAGYTVKRVGTMYAAIWKDDFKNLYHWNNYGSSAIRSNQKELKRLLTVIFDRDDEFYIIDAIGKMQSTCESIARSSEKCYTFTLWHRNIWTLQEQPLQQYKMTLAEMIGSYFDIAEKYSKDHSAENYVSFAMSSENPFFNYWNFHI